MPDTLPQHGLVPPVFEACRAGAGRAPLASGPFVLAAVTQAPEAAILAACANAVRYTRRDGSEWDPAADLALRELDYAFNELGWFVTRVGTYAGRGMRLSDWVAARCHPGVFFYLETFPAEDGDEARVVAARDGQVISVDDARPVPVADAQARHAPVGQVFMVTPASNVRWAN